MENVKTSLMLLGVHAIQGGLESFVIQILMTVLLIPLGMDNVMILEQMSVLMVIPRTHVSVWMVMLVITAPWTLIPVTQIPVRMVEHVPTPPSLLLNAPVYKDTPATLVM